MDGAEKSHLVQHHPKPSVCGPLWTAEVLWSHDHQLPKQMLRGQWVEGWWGRRTVNASESSRDSRCQTTTSFTGRNYCFYQNLEVCRVRLSSSLLSWNLHTFHLKNETCHPQSSKTMLPPPNKDGVLCSAFLGAGATPRYCTWCLVFPSAARLGDALESLAVKASETSQYQTHPSGLVRTLLWPTQLPKHWPVRPGAVHLSEMLSPGPSLTWGL